MQLRPCGLGFSRFGFSRFGQLAQIIGSVLVRFGQAAYNIGSVCFGSVQNKVLIFVQLQ